MNFYFPRTAVDDFKVLTNGIDDRISIICHKPTGFYNITKMANLINDLKGNAEPAGNPSGSHPQKLTKHWLANASSKRLTHACERRTGSQIP